MKKFLLTLVALILLPSLCWPLEVCKSSGRRIADASITTRASYLCGVIIETDGTNNATVLIWDSATAAAGTATTDELFKMIVIGADYKGGALFDKPIAASKGMYVDVTGTDAAYTIYYMAQ